MESKSFATFMASHGSSYGSLIHKTIQGDIEGGAASDVRKIFLEKGPPPSFSIDPAKYFVFNTLHDTSPATFVRKTTLFFLQNQAGF